MNKDMIAGNWKQLTGKVKEQWGKLTDDDLTVIEGKRDQLIGRVQERYGIARDKAAEEATRDSVEFAESSAEPALHTLYEDIYAGEPFFMAPSGQPV